MQFWGLIMWAYKDAKYLNYKLCLQNGAVSSIPERTPLGFSILHYFSWIWFHRLTFALQPLTMKLHQLENSLVLWSRQGVQNV